MTRSKQEGPSLPHLVVAWTLSAVAPEDGPQMLLPRAVGVTVWTHQSRASGSRPGTEDLRSWPPGELVRAPAGCRGSGIRRQASTEELRRPVGIFTRMSALSGDDCVALSGGGGAAVFRKHRGHSFRFPAPWQPLVGTDVRPEPGRLWSPHSDPEAEENHIRCYHVSQGSEVK